MLAEALYDWPRERKKEKAKRRSKFNELYNLTLDPD